MSRMVNTKAQRMFKQEEKQYKDLMKKYKIVENDKAKLLQVIADLDEKKISFLEVAYERISKDFGLIFATLLPGTDAKLKPQDGKSLLDGLEIKVGIGGIWKDNLSELSGGQKSLVALSLILAMLRFKPAPIYILEEVDAALDLSHTQNIGKMYFKSSQITMPIAVSDKAKGSEQMWNALKTHIIRERQRKKQEREAEVEEERLRKEREAREQQDVMSLGETREQISQLELKLAQLKDEKHQLFLQLKKVLNEDDNRRRQLVKENNDMLTIQALPSAGLVHPQLFLPQPVQRQAQIAPQGFKQSNKRTRSPSPPSQVPVSLYHQGYAQYKPQNVPNTSYQPPTQQKEDNRRGHELVRAVLWNKTPQYAAQPNQFYSVPPQEVVYYPPISREPPLRTIYDPQSRPQAYHIEPPKHVEHYSLRPSAGGHVQMQHNLQPAQPPKTGSITSGYPVRSQTQYQPVSASGPALYTTSARPMYQSPGNPMQYPTRD